MLQTRDSVYETPTQQSLQFDVSRLIKDNEIGTSVDPLKVLQKTMEKQNEELIFYGINSSTNRRDQIKDSIVNPEMLTIESKFRNNNVNSFRTL